MDGIQETELNSDDQHIYECTSCGQIKDDRTEVPAVSPAGADSSDGLPEAVCPECVAEQIEQERRMGLMDEPLGEEIVYPMPGPGAVMPPRRRCLGCGRPMHASYQQAKRYRCVDCGRVHLAGS